MRSFVVVACLVFVAVISFALIRNTSAQTYFLQYLPDAIQRAFFSHESAREKGGGDTVLTDKNLDGASSSDVVIDEEVRLQQSIKSVEEEIRRTEEFLQKKNGDSVR